MTGAANVCPSGPKRYGVPTRAAPAGDGALGSAVIVMVTVDESAPAGIVTEVPSANDTVPPCGPTWLADPESIPCAASVPGVAPSVAPDPPQAHPWIANAKTMNTL